LAVKSHRRALTALGLGLLSFSLLVAQPAVLGAAEPENAEDDAKVVIIRDDGDEVTIDMTAVHEIVAETMSGLDEVLAELEDMQLQVRLGKDNRLDLAYDDTTFELDLDQIMTQVASALREGFEEFRTEDWTHTHDRWTDVSEEDLRQELEDLQQEMKELRREIKKIKKIKNSD
jgi:hypothetical protein